MSEKSNIISISEDKEKKRKKGAQKKGGENSPISPPLDPRLQWPLTFQTFNKLERINITKNVCAWGGRLIDVRIGVYDHIYLFFDTFLPVM